MTHSAVIVAAPSFPAGSKAAPAGVKSVNDADRTPSIGSAKRTRTVGKSFLFNVHFVSFDDSGL